MTHTNDRPEKLVYRKENLGEVLRGDRITNTPYTIRMNENVTCRLLCMDSAAQSKEIAYGGKQIKRFIQRIK